MKRLKSYNLDWAWSKVTRDPWRTNVGSHKGRGSKLPKSWPKWLISRFPMTTLTRRFGT